ncbi:hypothetical protein [Devosia sp. FKR38]|uniref:hypothetical protein n=1 Tax=Devosia sp. FKR38 TaxID=2562312 RepID=UPI0010C10358|nr:hypothetical protein [Devosia sp. FKR38]
MTTAAEVKKWTRALTSSRDDIVLRGRDLFLVPIRHVVCGLSFPGSWDKTLPRPYWFASVPFTPPAATFGGKWRGNLLVGRSNEEGFTKSLIELAARAIDEKLKPLASLNHFFDATTTGERPALVFGNWERLQDFPDYHAPVLAALGRLEEAADVALGFVSQHEPRWQALRAEGERQIAGYRERGIGRDAVALANHQLALLEDLRALGRLSAGQDRAGVVALLHSWEQQGLERWNVLDLWEPTPFPLERSP